MDDVAPLTTRRAWLSAATMLLAVVAAIVIVHEQLGAHSFRDIVHEINAIPLRYMWLALFFTTGGYAVLTTFDYLALKNSNTDLTFARTAFASLIAFVRYRTFSSWPIPIATQARSVAFSTSSFWLGAAMVSGLGMIVSSNTLGHMLRVPEWAALVLGGVLLGGLAVYLYGRSAHPWLAIAQLIASTADWLLASAVLYAVLPHEIRFTFLAMASAFVIAQAVGMISHVPGGFGVFEATLLILLQNHEPSPTVLAALVAYRIVYYLIPFFIATVSLLIYETLQRQKGIMQVARVAGVWVPAAIPQALAVATFIAGTILLISGATPRASGRLAWLNHVIPLGVIEISHFAGSLIGVGLILLAWGLTRRLSGAFHIVVLLIALGIPASLLKGVDYEEATVLAILLITMIPARKHFYRHSALTAEMMTPGWMAAIVAVLAAVTWLGFFSFKHVQYREDIWWRFALRGDAPRFMRATVGVVAVTAAFAIRRLVRPAPPPPVPPTRLDLERARAIGLNSDDSAAALALLGDKRLLFDEENRGFLMYGVAGRSWVALHDPFGDDDTQRELAWRFREMVDKHGGWTVFYEVARDRLDLYLDLGLRLLKLGEEARVDLPSFDLSKPGKAKKLRQTKRNVEKEGFSFDVLTPAEVRNQISTLRTISDDWLLNKNTREKGFSLGSFSEEYICNFPVAIVRREQEIVAFANVWDNLRKTELSVDLMRYNSHAPTSVMEYLFISMMLWAKEQGYHEFNMGMAPLAGFHSRALAPLWTRAGAFVYRYGEHFYNFRGLRDYKSKFDPHWVPRYIATPGGLALPAILANVASLISGGYRGIITK